MPTYKAIVLICLKSIAPSDCDERSAIDILSASVDSELRCTMGWQEVIARSTLRDGIGVTSYVKTVCRMIPDRNDGRAGEGPR
jgi:hypothetical protein